MKNSFAQPVYLWLCLLWVYSACNTPQESQIASSSTPPNLVLILADDLGYADVGFQGCQDIPTPNIDRIANEGVIFTNGYVTWAACGPSRAGLITGRHQDRFGFSRNPLFAPNDPNMGLPLSEQTLAAALRQVEYQTVAIGKWHLGAHPTQRPLQRGFTDFFGFLTGGHRYFPEEWDLADEYEVNAQYAAYRTKLLRNTQRIEEDEYLTDALSREAAAYIQRYQDNPFFIYLAYNAPHAPMQATEKYLSRFEHIADEKRKVYAAMVSAVDDGVGRVLNTLDSLDLAENTLVVFLSDNGGPEHVNASDNGPLRGKKGDLFEGGIRVPFTMRWPEKIPPGTTYEKPVVSLDIFSTIIAPHGDQINLKNPLDGVDLIPYLRGEKNTLPHPTLFWRKFDQQQFAVRQGNTKLIEYPDSMQVFDLQQDLAEQSSLHETEGETLQALQQLQTEWKTQIIDPIFMGLSQNKAYNKLHPNRFERPQSN